MRKSWIAAAALLALAGCKSDLGTFTIASSKNVEVSRVDLKRIHFNRDVEGTDGHVWILCFPIPWNTSPVWAMDDCLANGRGDFMTSARLSGFWWHCLLFGYSSYRVRGDVGNSLGAGARDISGQQGPPASGSAADEERGYPK